MKTTRQNRMISGFALLCAGLLVTPCLSFGAVLTNGDFEAGPPGAYSYNDLSGWDGANFDGSFWLMITTNNPAPSGSNYSSSGWVDDGEYAVRRTLFNGQSVATITLSSSEYSLSSSGFSIGDNIDFSLSTRPQGQAGKFETYGTVTFYDNSHTLLSTGETSRVTSVGIASWTPLTVELTIPNNTAYFRVNGVINVTQALNNTAYAGFDNFAIVPEPTVTALAAFSALGLGVLRTHVRRRQGTSA